MIGKVGGFFNHADRLQMETLNQRLQKSHVINSNIANAETPGYRAIGYDFEDQLQEISGVGEPLPMKTSNPRHRRHELVEAGGNILPDVFVKPTESISNDGNTVDIDGEMAEMARNQILFRTAVETVVKKIGLIKYAIDGGR